MVMVSPSLTPPAPPRLLKPPELLAISLRLLLHLSFRSVSTFLQLLSAVLTVCQFLATNAFIRVTVHYLTHIQHRSNLFQFLPLDFLVVRILRYELNLPLKYKQKQLFELNAQYRAVSSTVVTVAVLYTSLCRALLKVCVAVVYEMYSSEHVKYQSMVKLMLNVLFGMCGMFCWN